jgi:hypothetical protein
MSIDGTVFELWFFCTADPVSKSNFHAINWWIRKVSKSAVLQEYHHYLPKKNLTFISRYAQSKKCVMVIVFCIILCYRCLKNGISRKTKHFGVSVFLVFENVFFVDNWNRCFCFLVNCMSRLLRLYKCIGYLKTWIRRATVTSWTWGKTSDFAVWHEVLTSNAHISESITDSHILFSALSLSYQGLLNHTI